MEVKDKVLTQGRVLYTYAAYLAFTETLVAEKRTSGPIQTEDYVHYTELNLQRMHRIDKTLELLPELTSAVQAIATPQTWLVLSEPWCGDAAQNVPIIARAAALNPHIDFQIVLRDENLDLMDQYLTEGGRGIPKLIIIDQTSGHTIATWGPRPEQAQQMIRDYKALEVKPPYMEFVIELQKWYAQDKTRSAQLELAATLQNL